MSEMSSSMSNVADELSRVVREIEQDTHLSEEPKADAHGELPPPRVRVQQDGGASAARRPRANMPTAATPEDNQYPGAFASAADGAPRSLDTDCLPELL